MGTYLLKTLNDAVHAKVGRGRGEDGAEGRGSENDNDRLLLPVSDRNYMSLTRRLPPQYATRWPFFTPAAFIAVCVLATIS